jgi:hypothetical protein
VPLERTPEGFLGDGELMVVSFDIDGTMEFGDPPGPVTVALVRTLVAQGHVVGCGSDRTRGDQLETFEQHGITLAFAGGKPRLDEVRASFPAERYVHIGDTHVDAHYAELHGFECILVEEADALAAVNALLEHEG